jgi:hypothetical protein
MKIKYTRISKTQENLAKFTENGIVTAPCLQGNLTIDN